MKRGLDTGALTLRIEVMQTSMRQIARRARIIAAHAYARYWKRSAVNSADPYSPI